MHFALGFSVGGFYPYLLALSSLTLTADSLTLLTGYHTCCLFAEASRSLLACFCYALL